MRWQWSRFDSLQLLELYTLIKLRQDVFVVEQACAYPDVDGEDPACWHLLGWKDGELMAYLRAFPPGHSGYPEVVIGRVIVSEALRGQGMGRVLMEEGHQRAEQCWGAHPIKLSAQAHLASFYGSLGYAVCGPGYDEDGIPHVPMRRPAEG